MKKRILIFSTAYLPLIGGAEVAVKEITDRILDVEFVMLTARLDHNLPEREQIGNVEVHRVGRGDNWDKFRLIWSGWRKAQKLGKFDTVWSIMASYAGFAALRYKKRNLSVPFLLTLQEGDSRWQIYKHVWWCWRYFKQIFTKADKIQAISNYLAKWAKDLGAICPIEVVPNGVNVRKFHNAPTSVISTEATGLAAESEVEKSRIRLQSNGRTIISVSRLVKKNGVGDLIQAMKFLSSDVQLVIAGIGELEAELKQCAVSLNLSDRVHFLGNVNHSELSKYLWASDVFCRPSLSEGLGNAFLEAMAAGVPIVGTNIGGIPDFLKDGETGLFCKVNDPKDIAHQIKRILDDPALAEKLRVNGKKLVEEKYNWEVISEKMKNIL